MVKVETGIIVLEPIPHDPPVQAGAGVDAAVLRDEAGEFEFRQVRHKMSVAFNAHRLCNLGRRARTMRYRLQYRLPRL